MKLNRRDRQTIDQTLIVSAQIHVAQGHHTDQVDRLHQICAVDGYSDFGTVCAEKDVDILANN